MKIRVNFQEMCANLILSNKGDPTKATQLFWQHQYIQPQDM